MAASRAWQGGLPFTYHLGPGPTQIALDVQLHIVARPIWVVVARIVGMTFPDEIVVAGNHRDAWVYGFVAAAPPRDDMTPIVACSTRTHADWP